MSVILLYFDHSVVICSRGGGMLPPGHKKGDRESPFLFIVGKQVP